MSNTHMPTTYKFKIANIVFSVNAGDFYSYKSENSAQIPDIKDGLHYHILHYHALHELLIIGEEPIKIRTHDGEREFKNCVIFLPAFLEHSTRGMIRTRLLFSFERVNAKHTDVSNFIEAVLTDAKPFTSPLCDTIVFFEKEFKTLIENNSELCDDMATAVLQLIFYHVFEQSTKNQKNKSIAGAKARDSYIIKIDAMVNDYRGHITLQTVANALCLSIKQTARIIKKNYNKSLSDLLTERRLRVAAVLLCEEKHSVSDVVQMVNFSSERYFYYQFKKTYGCTPQEYKRMHTNRPD